MRSVIQIPFYFGKLKLNLVLNTLKKMKRMSIYLKFAQ